MWRTYREPKGTMNMSLESTPKHIPSEGVSRREFLSRSFTAGVSVVALGTFLSSCGVTGRRQGGGGDTSTISIAINDSPWLPSFEQIVRVYQEETGNVVNIRAFPFEGLLSKELNAVNNKTGEFDLLNLHGAAAPTFYRGGFIAPLEEIDSGFEWPPEVINYRNLGRWDQDISFFSETGTVYALPINGNIQVLYYRQDLYDEMGLEPPTTWEEAIAAAKQVKKVDSDVYGYVIRGAVGNEVVFNFLPVLRSFGADVFANEPEDWSVTINSDEALQAIELYLELASYGPPEPESVGQTDMISLFQSGRSLQNHMVTAAYPDIQDEAASVVADKVGYAVVPKPEGGEHGPTIGAWHMGIPSHISDSQKQAAYDFLMWLMTKDAQMQYAQVGGQVTRQDVYEALGDQEEFRWMKAVADSTPYLHREMSYSFGPELERIMGRRLNEIVAGRLEPKKGLDMIAREIKPVVEEARNINL
jgi:multiple sugar transport system substrate-binding protein